MKEIKLSPDFKMEMLDIVNACIYQESEGFRFEIPYDENAYLKITVKFDFVMKR